MPSNAPRDVPYYDVGRMSSELRQFIRRKRHVFQRPTDELEEKVACIAVTVIVCDLTHEWQCIVPNNLKHDPDLLAFVGNVIQPNLPILQRLIRKTTVFQERQCILASQLAPAIGPSASTQVSTIAQAPRSVTTSNTAEDLPPSTEPRQQLQVVPHPITLPPALQCDTTLVKTFTSDGVRTLIHRIRTEMDIRRGLGTTYITRS
ncbi:hypothetical protein BCR44DRAFT_53451 [Catenaria anguillulae PL171]|uniref:Uncharacterized protein n=1 Tax=Catenaria anguillulae PL171 TaxID=765915 RepID=A0A1Y2H6P1_9FUNG|nr:hypothetical protein BCR44DRAFT_53451 [Catenaria anguillulae PL171]